MLVEHHLTLVARDHDPCLKRNIPLYSVVLENFKAHCSNRQKSEIIGEIYYIGLLVIYIIHSHIITNTASSVNSLYGLGTNIQKGHI